MFQITQLNNKIKNLEDELRLEKKDKGALKEQANNLSKEYDRLTEEYSKLQKKLTVTSDGDKKDE